MSQQHSCSLSVAGSYVPSPFSNVLKLSFSISFSPHFKVSKFSTTKVRPCGPCCLSWCLPNFFHCPVSQLNVHLCCCLIDSTCSLFTLCSDVSVHCHTKSFFFLNILLYLFVSNSFFKMRFFLFFVFFCYLISKWFSKGWWDFDPRGRLAMPGDIFGYFGGRGVLLTLTKRTPRMQLNILQYTGWPLQQRTLPRMSVFPRLGNPAT